MKRICKECGRSKDLSLFTKNPTCKLGALPRCSDCYNKNRKVYRRDPEVKRKTREYNISNREKRNAYSRERNKEPKRKSWMREYNWKYKLKKNYNLTPNDFNNLLTKQRNKCAICLNIFKKDNRAIHVDHCHKTNKIRGLLCPYCNVGMGNFFDNKNLLNKAIKYLDKTNRSLL